MIFYETTFVMLALGANEWATDLFTRGGVVMWPLLLLSVVGLTLVLERLWIFCAYGGQKSHPRLHRVGGGVA